MFSLKATNVSKSYVLPNGRSVEALRDISFSVKKGEFVSIVGPSGCGKTTLINLLAGLLDSTSGEILQDGHAVDGVTHDRGVMFQHYNLFPWLTVSENIAFGMHIQHVSERKINAIVDHYLDVMGLRDFADLYPKNLSGGMRQRVGLARMLATNPKILLMDEPFTALDVQSKRFMQDTLLQVWRAEPRTIIFVTHDVEEAIFLSDRVFIMSANPGTIREEIEIPLPRPRTLKTEFSSEFLDIKEHVQKVITKESLGMVELNLEIYKDI